MRNSRAGLKRSRWFVVGVSSLALALSLALAGITTGATPAGQPTISGTAEVGQILTSSSAGDSAVYKWESCDPAIATCVGASAAGTSWVHIAGANAQTYTVTQADAGHYLRVSAKGTSLGEQFTASDPVGPVPLPPSPSIQVQAAQAGLEPHHGNDFLINGDGINPVLIKVPGSNTFVPVESLRDVPFGSIVKAQGVATILSERGDGTDETAQFWGGTFKALQNTNTDSYFVAKLRSRLHCGNGNKGQVASKATASDPIATAAATRRLWGSGHGKFRSRGRGGAATVRGTTWWSKDTCNGTYFGVTEGIGIDVRDPGHKGLIFLQPGDKYFAEI
jgi:hypothetical protein